MTKKGANSGYWRNIGEAVSTLLTGLKLSFRHFKNARKSKKINDIRNENYFSEGVGTITVQYPHESIPVPDNGRYRLHNEIDDCIVCDKCAKICPVDCIEIEPIKAVEEIGKTSDGTSKRIFAAKFDIDMGKCCFCGLCTTVCPTECLTMTKVYDFSEFDVADHVYAFAEMTPLEILEKKKQLEDFNKAKAVPAKEVPVETNMAKDDNTAEIPKVPASKPVFKPSIPVKAPVTKTEAENPDPEKKDEGEEARAMALRLMQEKKKAESEASTGEPVQSKKPVFKPKIPLRQVPPVEKSPEQPEISSPENSQTPINENQELKENTEAKPVKPRPVVKPKIPMPKKPEDKGEGEVS
jgi:formate hydrogenlyase subunit 6/NADH:ubiquinone oxidoreductase subunit I